MIPLTIHDYSNLEGYDQFIESFRRKIKTYFDRGYAKNKKKGKIVDEFDDDTKCFFKYLMNGGLTKIAYSKPDELKTLISSIEVTYPNINDRKSNLYKNIYHAFVGIGYGTILNKGEFLRMLGQTCCPYCNRAYTPTVRSGKKTVKAEIDHFFNKETYPYLALSFYNLIPSCSLCNGYAGKHDKDARTEKLINPYEVEDKDLRFTFDINDIDAYYSNRPEAISVKLKPSPRFKPNVETFNLEELYAHHNDHVSELVHKSKIQYPATYRDFMQAACSGLPISKQDVNRLIVGNYTDEKNLHRRPLSKMYRDIARELNLID